MNEPGVVAVAWVLYEEPLADTERDRLMAPGMGTGVVAGDGPCDAPPGVEDRIKLWVPSDVPPLLASSILCRMACRRIMQFEVLGADGTRINWLGRRSQDDVRGTGRTQKVGYA